MIEKICKIINDEYYCDIDITIEKKKKLLTNPAVFDDKSKEAEGKAQSLGADIKEKARNLGDDIKEGFEDVKEKCSKKDDKK